MKFTPRVDSIRDGITVRANSSRINLFVTSTIVVVAAGLAFVPSEQQLMIRGTVQDAAGPAIELTSIARKWTAERITPVTSFVESFKSASFPSDDTAITDLKSELEQWKERARRSELAAAELGQKLDVVHRDQKYTVESESTRPLFVREVVKAKVLGDAFASRVRDGKVLGAGQADGIEESSSVLNSELPLLDQGDSEAIENGQNVLAGRTLVGRVRHAGRWVSSLQLVTDPEYRALVRFVHRTSQGVRFGVQGEYEGQGQGELGRVSRVAASEQVDVGDEVYASIDDAIPAYLGTVVKVEHEPQSPHWQIWVRPGVVDIELETVQVVRSKINPARMLAN